MNFTFKFPDIGEGIHEGKILEWYVDKGSKVKTGDRLVKMETDKVVDDIPAPRDGIILERYGSEEDTINVGDPLVVIEVEGTTPEPKTPSKKEEAAKEECFGVVGSLQVAKDSDVLPASDEGTNTKVAPKTQRKKALATPSTRALARKLSIDINQVTGTGKAGRVTKEDVKNFASSQQTPIVATPAPTLAPPTGSYEAVALTQIRKTIANRMVLSKNTAAHMTVFEEVEISPLVELKKQQQQKFGEVKLTYLPFIIKAVIRGLKQYKALNSQLDMKNNQVIYKYDYNVGIAVDAPDGLVVPVIEHADKLSIHDLCVKIMDLAQRARERKLSLSEIKNGTFTITNFGAIAGLHGVPVINYPEVGILGVGRMRQVPVVKDNTMQIGHILPLSLSVDHRIVDGGDATRFLRTVMDLLADPVTLLMY